MKFVQAKFAAAADLQNKRNTANVARSSALRKTIAANKALAAKNLENAVTTQQRAMSTLSSYMNARIDQTNKHVAANAAQISENAKKARAALDAAVAMFDTKVANARAEAAAGRSKLAAQLAAQDKSIRQWANNKLKIVMAKTAAQFRRVREKMAEDRHHADLALKSASKQMTAALDAEAALRDQQYAKTVSDIAAAKKEAKDRVEAANTSFKTSLYSLTATVNEQVQKTNARIDQLSATVQKNKAAQAKINANVAAETKRMINLGNKRYEEGLKKDAELKSLIDSNKAATDARMQAMAAHYTMELNAVRATMKKNRAHASHMLAKKTSALYSAIEANERSQMKTNGKLKTQTREAVMEISNSLREAKDDFAKRLTALHTVVTNNDKKFESKMDKLTGIVRANAIKNKKGRENLANIQKANEKEPKASLRDAVKKGEDRMAAAEKHLVDLNAKTKNALNMKITTEISNMAKRAATQIENLRLTSKEARAEMKKELLFAIRSMADDAKKNLDAAVDVAKAKFTAVNAAEATAAKKSAEDRAAIAESIKIEKENAAAALRHAAATMHRSLLALKYETEEKIKKTNTRVDAYAEAIKKEAHDASELMSGQMTTLTGKIAAQKAAASEAINAADAASVAGFSSAMDEVEASLKAAAESAEKKFGQLTVTMADQRAALDNKLGAAVDNINDSIAKQAALADSRFSKTVKDIASARKEASEQVIDARKEFATELAVITASIKDMDTRMTGEVSVVSGQVISFKAEQARVNRHVAAEINRIDKLMDHRFSVSKRARGKLHSILNENKKAAHEEVEQLYANEEAAARINTYSKESMAAIAASKKDFETRLDTLTNVVAANHNKVEKDFEVLTGVIRDYKEAGEKDRELIKDQNAAMAADMQKAITQAIQKGEAEANAVAQRARQHLAAEKQSMLIEITNTVEETADQLFKTVQGKHQNVADNYLSLKAYAISAETKVVAYVGQGKGKNLSSLGDLLVNCAALSSVEAGAAEGLSPSDSLPAIFTADRVKIDNKVSKINGLVNEYVNLVNGVRMRWPMGLGKYLLLKLEASMSEKGVLQVDKVAEKAGNWVYINGEAVGLSNKLNDFEGLAVRMAKYEASLAKLTASLKGAKKTKKSMVYAAPPEWQGQ